MTNPASKGQTPFYDINNTNGWCPHCNWRGPLSLQKMYKTQNGNRTYGTCPSCKDKRPLRKRPRTRDHWLKRHELKRI